MWAVEAVAELDRSAVLRVLTFNAGFLGPALIRKRFLEAVSGFPEDVKFAEVSRLMLKIAAEGGTFIEARSALPLVLIRQMPNASPRFSNIARWLRWSWLSCAESVGVPMPQ